MRAVDIVSSDGNERQLEATPIGANHHLSRRLARRVRIRRRQNARLTEICRAHRDVAIYLIRRDMYKSVHAMLPSPL
jgi:hypothetical protein